MQLRDYQLDCIDTIVNTFKKNNRQLIQLPTGSGKTYIFLHYLSKYSKKALVICPTKELVEQIRESSTNFFHSSEVFAKLNKSGFEDKRVTILTTASLNHANTYEYLIQHNFDTIVIDEAHKAQCETYQKFLARYSSVNSNYNILGFTATPERMDGKPLLDIFGDMSFDMNLYDLIIQGHLCDIQAYRIETNQKINTQLNQGDFRLVELKKLNNESRNNVLCKVIEENYQKKPSIVFCIDIEHSDFLAGQLRKKGINSQSIHGRMSFYERKNIINKFKNREIDILTNCQLLTEGFDAPLIENIFIARPTRSKSLYFQMIGRGVRFSPGKEICTLYELTDNNHKICTFNVAAGKENDFIQPYPDKVRLTQLHKELEDVKIETIITKKEKIDLLENPYLEEDNAFEHQEEYLKKHEIRWMEPLSYLEAAFLIWKHKLKGFYGNDKRKKRSI